MKAVFLADAHLTGEESPGYRELMTFLADLREARQGNKTRGIYTDALFLVGDYFDFWFARGARIYPPFREVLARLVALKEAGVRIHLIEGNHDFFLADYFCRHLKMEVSPDWAEVELEGRRILISHGDTINADDDSYRLLRRFLRSGFFYRLQRLVPLSLLFAAARQLSRTSRELRKDKTEELAENLHAFGRAKLDEGFDAIVLGHCHKPLLMRYNLRGREAISVTLGGWNNHQSYLYFEDGVFSLHFYGTKNDPLVKTPISPPPVGGGRGRG